MCTVFSKLLSFLEGVHALLLIFTVYVFEYFGTFQNLVGLEEEKKSCEKLIVAGALLGQ